MSYPYFLNSIRDVRDAIALYAVFSFSVIGYDDVFTIFASTSTDYGNNIFLIFSKLKHLMFINTELLMNVHERGMFVNQHKTC